MSGLICDLFAGGGGASLGLELALGRHVDIAINHDAVALAAHRANHPRTRHLEASVWDVRPVDAVGGAPVDVLWASPDCTHFSVAKGNVPRCAGKRSLAWAVHRWAKAVRPRLLFIENVREFQGWGPLGKDGRPDKRRAGKTFAAWVGALERLGYAVEWRVLDASAYGAPTRRRRLFIVGRCDGEPIRWPAPTHGPGLAPFRTAAECIDWSIPCPSIFERKRPLANKTLWRIAEGLRRFVFNNPRPFIVEMNHSNAPREVTAPLGVVTTQHNRFQVVAPTIAKLRHDSAGARADEPLPTITAGSGRSERPAGAGHALGVVAPVLATIDQQGAGRGATGAEAPLPTIVTKARHVVVAPTLINTRNGEREGQRPRALDLEAPAPTVTAKGSQGALVAAFLDRHFGDRGRGESYALPLDRPSATVTSRDHQALTAASLVRFNHNDAGVPLDTPMPTVTARSNHIAEVRAFLTTYYGGPTPRGSDLFEPLRTQTTENRFGLVTVAGVDYEVVDIGMRMLEPHELLRAQFGEHAERYDLSAAKTKAAKVRLIGNSVAPHVAEALVRANVPAVKRRAVAGGAA